MRRLHHPAATRATAAEHPEILGDVFAWNKLFRRTFWESAGLAWPEGIRYEDQPTTTRAYLAGRFDVLPDVVYHWRIRDDGSSITQQRASVDDLRDRLETKRMALASVDGLTGRRRRPARTSWTGCWPATCTALVLLLDFLERTRRRLGEQVPCDRSTRFAVTRGARGGSIFLSMTSVPRAAAGADIDLVHQAMRTDQSKTHARPRLITPAQDVRQVRDTRALVTHADHQQLRCGLALEHELDLAAAGITERVAGDLGYRGRDARLVLAVEIEQRRDLPGSLAGHDDMVLTLDRQRQQNLAHAAAGALSAGRSDEDSHVVAAAIVVAIEYTCNRAPDAGSEARIVVEIPVCIQAVRMHDQQRIGAKLKGEFLHTAHVVPDRAIVRDQVAQRAVCA